MDIVSGVVGGVVSSVAAVSEARDRKKSLKHQQSIDADQSEIMKDSHAMERDKHSVRLEAEHYRTEKERTEMEMRKMELKNLKEQEDKDAALIEAVDASNVFKICKLTKSPHELEPSTLDMSEEIALIKNNPVILKLLEVARKKVDARKMMPDVQNLFAFFQEVDKDDSGAIDAEELQSALSNGTWKPFDIETINTMICNFDKDGNGELSFDEFGSLWKILTDVQQCFLSYDTDNIGRLSKSELKRALSSSGFRFGDRDYDALLKRFGMTCIGGISLDEFIRCNFLLLNEVNEQISDEEDESEDDVEEEEDEDDRVTSDKFYEETDGDETDEDEENDEEEGVECRREFEVMETFICCLECRKADGVIMCGSCFVNSEHVNHKYETQDATGSGAFCDCGISEEWTKHPTCRRHLKKNQMPLYVNDEEKLAKSKCQQVFSKGENCYTCLKCRVKKKGTMLMCGSCFFNSSHMYHEYVVYKNEETGGFCDCGYKKMWKKDHTCFIHDY